MPTKEDRVLLNEDLCHKCGRGGEQDGIDIINDGDDHMGPAVCCDCFDPDWREEEEAPAFDRAEFLDKNIRAWIEEHRPKCRGPLDVAMGDAFEELLTILNHRGPNGS